jgi:glutamate carboxypeptidase
MSALKLSAFLSHIVPATICLSLAAGAAPLQSVQSLAAKEKAPLLETLKDLVSIESGSGDREGLDKIADLIANRLRALGGAVTTIEPNPTASSARCASASRTS